MDGGMVAILARAQVSEHHEVAAMDRADWRVACSCLDPYGKLGPFRICSCSQTHCAKHRVTVGEGKDEVTKQVMVMCVDSWKNSILRAF